MNYWLTTHWPPRADETERFSNTGAWVADGKQAVLSAIQPGDMLFIYESKSGKTIIEKTADGIQHRVRRKQGQQGVVARPKSPRYLQNWKEAPQKHTRTVQQFGGDLRQMAV